MASLAASSRIASSSRSDCSRAARATAGDAAVKTLGQAPFGKFLLILAALGIAAFDAYSFIRAKYNRM